MSSPLIKSNIIFILILVFTVSLNAQSQIIGKITDARTNNSLPGANIQILGTIYGASSDQEGTFVIKKVPPGIYSIRVSMIGYRNLVRKDIFVGYNKIIEINFELHETPIAFDPIVITAGKTKQRLDQVPVSLSVVTAEDIKRRNPTDLIGALEMTSGVHFVGNQINIRGSTGYAFGAGTKVLLLLDGVPIHASDTGEINWDALPPLDIEQIEVLKGAGSSLWGAAALGGIVNIITRSPSPEGKILFSATAGKYDKPYYSEWTWTNHERLHYFRTDVNYSKRFNQLGLSISAGQFTSTGYTQLGDFEKYNLTGKLDYRFANNIKWTGYAAYSYIDRGFFVQWKGQNDPYEVDETNLNNYAKTNQLNLYTKLAIQLSARFGINFRASMIRTLMGNQFGEGDDFNPAFGQGVESQADWIPLLDHLVTFGLQYQHDTGSTKFFGDHKGYFIGPYIQDEWKFRENLRLTTGFRYDRYQLIDGAKEDLFSPRIGVNWQPWSATILRASAGSGFRAATIVERFLELSIMNFNIKANPDLKAEKSWAYDLGFRQYISQNWNVDISLFRNDYENLIEPHLDLIRGQIQFRNVFNARIQGIEANTSLSQTIRLLRFPIKTNWQTSLTMMDHKDLKWNKPLTYRPNVLAIIQSSFQVGPARLQIDYRYASKIDEVKIYPINDRVPMKFLDVRLSYEIWKLTLQLGVNNLLQYNYAPMESNLMAMRTFVVSVQGEI
jgi:outer membrane receptor for ferrienterochelin and colicins